MAPGRTDRIPIAGVVGRESGQIRLCVCHHTDRATLQPYVESKTRPDAIVNTDEWQAYNHLPETGRIHKTVCHKPGQRESGCVSSPMQLLQVFPGRD